jgi:hypothetical protein
MACHPEPRRRVSAEAFAHMLRGPQHDSAFILISFNFLLRLNRQINPFHHMVSRESEK